MRPTPDYATRKGRYMLITDIRTYHAHDGSRNSIFLHVFTSEGVTGVGEPYTIGPDEAVLGLIESVKPWFVGQDPGRIEWLLRRARNNMRFPLAQVAWSALSGIEMALWDIQGKALGLPVYMLLGGRFRKKVRVYHGLQGATLEALAEHGLALRDEGYTAFKLGPYPPGYQAMPWNRVLRECAIRMGAVRRVLGDSVDIGVDIHTTIRDPYRSRDVIDALKEYRPMFVEEPTRAEHFPSLARLREQVRVPIATGENLFGVTQFNDLLDAEGVDIIQPDPCVCGGLLETKKIAAAAEAHYVTMAPHNPLGLLSTACGVHLGACTPNFIILEFHGDHNRPKSAFVDEMWKPVDGYFPLPTRPGLGLELNLEAIAAHPAKEWTRGFPVYADGAPAYL